MMNYRKIKISKLLVVVSLFLLIPFSSFSQEKELISPYITLQYFKNTDGLKSLKTILTYSVNRMELPLPRQEIFFYTGTAKVLLASVSTDDNGIATFPVDEKTLPVDKTGQWSFISEYNGNDTIEAASSDPLNIKDLTMEMTLSEEDSIKTISIKAFSMENGKPVPDVNEMISVYVPRMFSLLSIGDIFLDENGMASLEFPSDIPGDKSGNITIISKLEDHPLFGNVEKRETLQWGVPTSLPAPVVHRALWTKEPPMWMIVTLSILLTGVWGHYLFAVISLILIKIDSKKKKTDKEEYGLN
jgi:hypothetical protein